MNVRATTLAVTATLVTLATLLTGTGGMAAQTTTALTAEDAGAFLDGLMPYAMERGGIPGAAVVVVADGRILVERGYGLADVEKGIPVAADRTLFRPGSTSKLFTWTALMQQIEAGKVELDRDVNDYLDFSIPDAFGEPITVRHLMTHTAGFEERLRQFISVSPDVVKPLGEALSEYAPARINPPGAVPAYSNYATALAGYVIERVSGEPFAEYIDRHIFRPLGMTRTTFLQPPPERFGAVPGYLFASGERIDFEYTAFVPAGAATTTARDMASFMLAHLSGGALPGIESSRILSQDTVTRMHDTTREPAPGINAMALGFYEDSHNGVRALAHGGDSAVFHTDLHILPDHGVGIFVSVNSDGKGGVTGPLRDQLFTQFMDRYFPDTEGEPVFDLSPEAAARARFVAGTYRPSRRSQSTWFSFMSLPTQVKVWADDDGALRISSSRDLAGKPRTYREVAPWSWLSEDGDRRVAAKLDDDGQVQYLASGPIGALQPVPGWLDTSWLLPAVGFGAAIVILWLLGALLKVIYRKALGAPSSGRTSRDTWLMRASAAMAVALLAAGAAFLGQAGSPRGLLYLLSADVFPLARTIQFLALLSVVAALVAITIAIRSWLGADTRRSIALARSALAAGVTAIAYFAVVAKLVDPSMNY